MSIGRVRRIAIALALVSTVASGGLELATEHGAAAAPSAPTKLVVIDMASGVPAISATTVAANQVGITEARLETGSAITAFPDVGATPQSVGTDGDPLRSAQWALDAMHVDGAHSEGYDGAGQTVAVIDTGVYTPHEDLGGQIVESVDMLDGLPGFRYHGTAVAGIIAANAGNGIGVEGIAPGAKLLDIRVCTPTMCPSDAILKGIVWAVQHHATVINMSLGGGSPDWAPVLSWAKAQGVVIVAAAGNAGCQLNSWNGSSYVPNQYCSAAYLNNAREWPAADPHVIAVGAMQQDGTVATYSSYGSYLDLAAPTGVLTTTPPYYDSGFAGTSAAAPHVAAVAALVRQANPDLTPTDVQAVLEASAVTPAKTPQHLIWTPDLTETDTTTINPQMLVGAGVVDAQSAVDLARTWNARTSAPVATAGAGQLALSWPAIDGAASYRVRVNNTIATTTTNTSFTATGLNNYGEYVVEIDALDGNGALESASKPVLATPDDAPMLAPLHLAQLYSASYSGDLLMRSDTSWDGNRILNLYRADQPGLAVASTSGMSNSLVEFFGYRQTDPSVRYYVTWSDLDNHESTPSNPITVNALSKPLAAPTNLQAATGDASVTLSWDPVVGASAYMYYDFPTNTWTTTTATSVVETGLSNGRPYSGNVYAKLYNDGNTNTVDSFASSLFQFMPLPPTPGAPTVTVSTSNTGLTVTWSAVPGATGYNVYRDDGFAFGTFPGQTSQFLAYGAYTTPGRVYHFVAQPYIYFDTWGFTEFGEMSDPVIGGSTTTTTTSTSTTSTTSSSTTTTSTVAESTSTTSIETTTTSTSVPASTTTTTVAPSPPPHQRNGYWMLGADGRVYPFGDARHLPDARFAISRFANDRAAHLEPTSTGNGYRILDTQGRVYAFGDARLLGGLSAHTLAPYETARTVRHTPTDRGYWIVTTLGRVFAFGDAHRYGNAPTHLNAVVVDAVATPSGRGYWLFGADGGVFAYGDARFYGSAAGHTGGHSIVAAMTSSDGRGYLLVNAVGKVLTFGDAPNRGSVARGVHPMTAVSADGNGYVIVDVGGLVYSFCDRPTVGSLAGRLPIAPIISIAAL